MHSKWGEPGSLLHASHCHYIVIIIHVSMIVNTAICHHLHLHLHLLMNFLRYYHPSSSRYQEDRNKLWNCVLLPESVLKQFTVMNGSGKRLLLIQEIMVQMQKSHWYNQLGMGSDTYTHLLTNRSSRMTRFRLN